ncbi:helix-turn-helix domain-containing protein [Pseudomonas nitroreducens]|uniref:helix-turn-helix domain-containing protein n=1 Tax=Pseudomonas nitroreducens TaxID=46680 RepID=UPI003828125E
MTFPNACALRLPLAQESSAACDALYKLAPLFSLNTGIHQITLLAEDGGQQALQVPALAMRLFGEILSEIALGHAVRVVPVHAELTTQEAADLLNVSRPTLVRLLDHGAMPYTKTGSHRRIKLRDLVDYYERRDAANFAALDELAAQAQRKRLGY